MPDESYMNFIAARRREILDRIHAACSRAGRDASGITLFAVSKTVGVDEVLAAMAAGYTAFAENRPQELSRKTAALEAAGVALPRFDMIGNLQTNKINQVLGRAACIQSVSSYHLAEAVSKRAENKGIIQDVLIEVNVSGEQSKSGFSANEAHEAAQDLLGLSGIRITGLMTMAPAGSLSAARVTFEAARDLAASLSREDGLVMDELSFGMSDDFEVAVEAGATMVRLGRIVFDSTYTAGF